MIRIFRSAKLQHGATVVEFLVVAPMVIFLILGIMQSAFFYMAKTQVNYAAEFAARYASTRNGTERAIKKGLKAGLISLQGGSSSPGPADLARRYARAVLAFDNPVDVAASFQRINPTEACFRDWGAGAQKVIPNAHLNFRSSRTGRDSGLSIQDCNILKIRLVYGYKPVTPLIRQVLMTTLRTMYPLNPMYRRDRIPIEAVAIVHMQSDVRR